ncbi:hypothetical protein [Microbispora sp. GKU 823]|uniref:hypothetical protein n=1 Tax=Microbispora sp. GKU 823 TaxID=1652100 RepID=UPI0009A27190|nr:hypothetical protein [Microbispora sp. GKU 823]OPG13658.1 hypothetical protein B1L11_06635 [Microbispora sp. GKU 823]
MPNLKTQLAAGIRRGPESLDIPFAVLQVVTGAALAAWDFILGPGGHLAFTEAAVAIWALAYIVEKRKRRQAEAQLTAHRQEHPHTPTP